MAEQVRNQPLLRSGRPQMILFLGIYPVLHGADLLLGRAQFLLAADFLPLSVQLADQQQHRAALHPGFLSQASGVHIPLNRVLNTGQNLGCRVQILNPPAFRLDILLAFQLLQLVFHIVSAGIQ